MPRLSLAVSIYLACRTARALFVTPTLQDVRTVVSMPVTHQAWQVARQDQAEFSVWHSCPSFFVLDGQFRYADRFLFGLQNWTTAMICRWSRLHISKTERLCLVVVMVPPVRG